MSSVINYKERFEEAKQSFESRGYKPIHIYLFDPVDSIFASDKNKREYLKIIWCNKCESCEAYKKGKCFMINNVTFRKCPFSKIYYEEGVTKRSKSYLPFIKAAKEVLDISNYKITSKSNALRHTCSVGDGSYIYLHLHHLDNYVNPIAQKLEIRSEFFIPSCNFTLGTIKELLDYRPLALMGGEITTYAKEDLPQFIRDLKLYFPNLYSFGVKGTKYEILDEQISYVGKEAFLKTLLPGKVKFNFNTWDWNGEKLNIRGKGFCAYLNDNELVELTPTDKTIVEVLDDATVNPLETRFKEI